LEHAPRTAAHLAVVVAAVVVVALFSSMSGTAAAASPSQTVVSLTFDDGTATQYAARSLLVSHGMNATFYINSSKLGTDSYYMTWSQVDGLAADGNEIGGHTAFHVDLTQTDSAEAKREVCDDRVNLLNRGYQVRSFAYPFGAFNTTAESTVRDCGYNSARTTNQFVPPPAESIPPKDPYAIRVAGSGGGGVSLATLESYVTKVEQNGGGWAPLVFHQICDGCDGNAISESNLQAFLDWLKPRATSGTVVKPVGDVVGGAVQPAVAGPPPPAPPNGTNALRNASLEQDSDANKAPDCWDFDSWGNNSYVWNRTTDAHTGSYAERVDVSKYVDGDSKLSVGRDLGFCTPSVTPGHKYRLTAWYKSNAAVSFATFTRDSLGGFYYWTTSPSFPASSTWTQASWVTPAVRSGANGLSFGLTIASNGFLTVDDLGLDDAAATGGADTTPPTVALTSPANGATVAGAATISASASDNVAIDHVDYLVDGSVVGTQTSGPFSYSWNSRSVPNGTHTIAARAVDSSSNATTSSAVSVTVANSATTLLQNASLETATNNVPTCWLTGGYGTNTFAWTRTSDAHTGSFAEKLDVTAYTDGDRKLVSTQDSGTCAPAVTAGHTYTASVYYKSNVQPRIFAYYRSSSGIWTYWASASFPASPSSWSQATWTTPAVPSGATHLSVGMGLSVAGSVTMDDFALFDNVPLADTTPPTTAIGCNGPSAEGGCGSGWYSGPVDVTLSATDTGGSGLKEIRYTTDGSDPTAVSGTVYSGPFSVTSTTRVKYRAFDNAGNAEAVNSQLIQIDPTAPTVSLTAPTDGATVSGTTTLTASAADNVAVDRVDFLVDGQTVGSDASAPYSAAWDSASVVDGAHTIVARAVDTAGNATSSTSTSVTVANGAPTPDTTAPATTISCNGAACASSYYNAAVSVGLTATDNAGGSGVKEIRYTTDGSDPTATSGTVYSGPFSVTSTTTVNYRAFDNADNAEAINSQRIQIDDTAPTVSLTAPADGATVSGTTPLTATATDDVAVDHVDFRVDGQTVGSDASAPYGVDWDSPSVTDGAHVITARAVDSAGNATTSTGVPVTVGNGAPPSDTTAPTTTIGCNAVTCASSYYDAAVSVTLAASDNAGGSGVREIRYTTDGSDPTAITGTVYSGAFSVAATATVKYRAFDNAGNAEAVNSQVIRVDTTAPTTTISCNAAACASSYYNAAVSVLLAATDNSGGSGVKEIRYTTDGSDPTATGGTLYSGPFSAPSTITAKYRAFDNAGNAEAIKSQLIRIDTIAPAVALTAPAGGATVTGSVKVTANPSDPGSGIAKVTFYLDGKVLATVMQSPYSTQWNTKKSTKGQHTLTAVAQDNAGNTTTSSPVTVTVA
jgi:peptidoglycan/xylan/chitin deacetylase (PgdA/CDA1 family)